MMELKCGRGVINLDLPGTWQTKVLEPQHPQSVPLEETLMASLARPIGEKPLKEWLPGKNILLVVPDVTRYMGADWLLPIVCEKFFKGYKVEIIFALGNLRKQ